MRLAIPVPKRWRGKLKGAWIAMVSACIATGVLGYKLGSTEPTTPSLKIRDDVCKIHDLTDPKFGILMYICQQDDREYLVVPLSK